MQSFARKIDEQFKQINKLINKTDEQNLKIDKLLIDNEELLKRSTCL